MLPRGLPSFVRPDEPCQPEPQRATRPARLLDRTECVGPRFAFVAGTSREDRLRADMCTIWPSFADYKRGTDHLVLVAILD